MNILDLINRTENPIPWDEGDNIPWNEPGFSERMLKEHLSQEHDSASRRFDIIDAQIEWIHRFVLLGKPSRILDLACGPGFYSFKLAELGHSCKGVDYSPAAIDYAMKENKTENRDVGFLLDDIRTAEYGDGFDLVMFVFGEFNVMRPDAALTILRKSYASLKPGGVLLLEPHTIYAVNRIAETANFWYSGNNDELFSECDHLCLSEHYWDEEEKSAVIRYFVIDAKTSEVSRFAQTIKGYDEGEYEEIIEEAGFTNIEFHPPLGGAHNDYSNDLLSIIAHKK